MHTGLLNSTAHAAPPALFIPSAPAVIVPPEAAPRSRVRFRDAAMTFDRATIDSTGAFLVGELERLDQTLHMPLYDTTWSRDVLLREDVTIGDELSSYTNSTFASPGGLRPNGISWIGKDSNEIQAIALDIGKTAQPLYLWGEEVSYTIPELESAQRVGRPVDAQKYQGMQIKHDMDTDQMVNIGDSVLAKTGLWNSTSVIVGNVVAGASGSTLWTMKTPDEILADVNTLLTAAWAANGYAIVPSELRLPPAQYSYLVSQKISNAGNQSILEFLRVNSLSNARNNKPLNIQPVKWLVGLGSAGTDRMATYTNRMDLVRYPMVPLQRTPLEYRSIFHITTYFGRLGVVEWVYANTAQYADGI